MVEDNEDLRELLEVGARAPVELGAEALEVGLDDADSAPQLPPETGTQAQQWFIRVEVP